MLMTALQYRDFMEAKFAEYIRPLIAKDIANKTRRLIGSATPLRWDHPEWGLAMRLFRWDRSKLDQFKRKKARNIGEVRPKKSSI